MSVATALWTAAGLLASAVAVTVLLRAAPRYSGCSAACRWRAAAAAAFIAANLDTGPISGTVSPLTLADLLGLLALPVLVTGLASLASAVSAPDRTGLAGSGLAEPAGACRTAARQAPGRIEAARRLAIRRQAARRLTRAFLRWAVNSKLMPPVTVPHQDTANPAPISQRQETGSSPRTARISNSAVSCPTC